MALDVHVKKLVKGRKFLRRVKAVCDVLIWFVLVGGVALISLSAYRQGGLGDRALGEYAHVAFSLIPYILFSRGMRHLDNLFGATQDALEELKTTV